MNQSFIKMRRLILLLSALLAVNSYAIGPLQSKRYLANNGGLVNHISPLLVPQNSASGIENISLDDRGDLISRNGYSIVVSTLSNQTSNVIVGGGFHRAAVGSDFFAVIAGSDVYRIGTAYTSWSKVTGTAALTLGSTNYAQETDFNDAAIFCNEVDTPVYVTASANALTITTNTFSNAKTCATYGNYLIAANTVEGGTNFPNRVRWSDINTQNSFPALNFIDDEPGDGDKIVSIIAFDESVYIFKQRSIYQMLITGGAGPDAFIVRPVVRNIGAWAKNSVRVIPTVGIAFLAQNTAYLLNNNGLTPIGDSIQRSFDAITRSQWQNATGGVYPKKYQYWLAVSTAGTTNTEVLVYDYVQNNWTIYDGMNLSMISQSQNSSGDNILLSGGYLNTVYQQDNGTSDNPSTTPTNISRTYTTGDLFTDSLDLTKTFKYLYLVTTGDHNYTVTMKAAYDLNTIYELSQGVTVGATSAVYDTGVYDTDNYVSGTDTITRFELNRSAKTIRLQFTQADQQGSFGIIGWTIVFAVEDYKE